MTSTKNKITIVVAVIFVIAIAVLLVVFNNDSSANGFSVKDTGDTIKIGAIMPLSGDAAAYGIPLQKIADLAVKEINDAGGIKGKKLKIIYEDGTCDAKGATSSAQKLINVDGVKIIFGGLCSGETLGAAPITEANKVILFSAASGSPDITNAGDYVFRNFPSDATSGSKVARAAIERGDIRIAIIAEQTDYSIAVKRVFRTTFENLGGDVLVDEAFVSDSSDFRAQLTKIKNANPDAIYLVTQTPAKYGQVLKQLRELDINQQIYTNEFAAVEEILENYPDAIEGAIFAIPAFDETSDKSAELINKLNEKLGDLGGALPPVYFATTYDAIYILKESIDECGEETDCIRDFLYDIKDRDGFAGLLSIDSNGDAEFEYVLKSIKNGEVTE